MRNTRSEVSVGSAGHVVRDLTLATEDPSLPMLSWLVGTQPGVSMPAEMAHIPCLMDQEGELVPLFQVFAIMEENTDFVAVCKALPSLPAATVDTAFTAIYEALRWNLLAVDTEAIIDRFGHGQAAFDEIRRQASERAAEVSYEVARSSTEISVRCVTSQAHGYLEASWEDTT